MAPDIEPRLRTFCEVHGLDAAIVGKSLLGQAAYSIEGRSDRPFDGKVEVLRIHRSYGQLGNNFYQLLNALVIARRIGGVELQMPPMQGLSDRFPIDVDGVRLTGLPPENDPRPTLVGVFFAPYGFERYFTAADLPFTVETIQAFVRPLYGHILAQVLPLGADVLVMHFRGGDVFRENGYIHPWYVQPPAAYYILALEYAQRHFGVASVQLVSQDRVNPAIGVVEQYLTSHGVPYAWSVGDLPADLRCLLGARHIVAPYGTFCEALAMLSEHCRSFFGFRDIASQFDMAGLTPSQVGSILRHRGVRTILVDDPDQTFIKPRMWDASQEQRQLLREFPKDKLRIAEVGANRDPAAADEPGSIVSGAGSTTAPAMPVPQPFGVVSLSQPSRKRIFDCFTFFNELELLKLRMNEMYDHVDCFVISESTRTFKGQAKPLYFSDNKEMFKEFLDKVKLVIVDDMPAGPDAWVREFHQRAALRRGLVGLNDDDIVIVSDVDEIIRPSALDYVRGHAGYFMFDMPMYQFYLNMRAVPDGWIKVAAYTWRLDSEVGDYNSIRQRELETFERFAGRNHRIKNAGWHFTFLGGAERVREKLNAYSHAESWQQQMLRSGEAERQMVLLKDVGGGRHLEYCDIDEAFPSHIRNNLKHFRELGYVKDAPSRIRELVGEYAQANQQRERAEARERYWLAEIDRLRTVLPMSPNLALNKPANQSSTNDWSRSRTPTVDARGGNDGTMREPSGYGFHTDRELNPWWQVDLQEDCLIEEIRIHNRKGSVAERLRHFSVLKSDDGDNWSQIFQKSDNSIFDQKPYIIPFDPAERARFIRIRLDGDNWLHFDQCLVYGRTVKDGSQAVADRARIAAASNAAAVPDAIDKATAAAVTRYLAGSGPFKLQIGHSSGTKSDWLTVDQEPAPAPILPLDVPRRLPIPDNSFDFIRSEHMIQRIPFQIGLAMLRECHRILKPGGVLRVITPSMDSLRQVISPDHSALQERYLEWSVRSSVPDALGVTAAFFMNNFMRNWGHTFIYDLATLRLALENAGFDAIVEATLGESDHEQLRGLEDEGRLPPGYLKLESMGLEGVKR